MSIRVGFDQQSPAISAPLVTFDADTGGLCAPTNGWRESYVHDGQGANI